MERNSLIDKMFVIDGVNIDFTDNFKIQIENIFNKALEEAIDNKLSEAEMDGIEVVLNTMNSMGMAETMIIVENRLIADNVIIVKEKGKNEDDEEEENDGKDDKKRPELTEGLDYQKVIAKMIG